jgi:hypothetical protein
MVTTGLERVKQTRIFIILLHFFFCLFSMPSLAIAFTHFMAQNQASEKFYANYGPRILKPATDPYPMTE